MSILLGSEIPWTLVLVGTATVIAFFVGTALGILAGWRHGGWLDRSLPALMFLQAIPYFFLALLLVYIFAYQYFHLFPSGTGYDGSTGIVPGWHWDFITNAVQHAVLPALTIVITSVAGWMLQMRNVMITTTRRGLRDRGAGQGPAQPPGGLHLRGQERAAAAAARVRPGPGLCRVRRDRDGDRVRLSRASGCCC